MRGRACVKMHFIPIGGTLWLGNLGKLQKSRRTLCQLVCLDSQDTAGTTWSLIRRCHLGESPGLGGGGGALGNPRSRRRGWKEPCPRVWGASSSLPSTRQPPATLGHSVLCICFLPRQLTERRDRTVPLVQGLFRNAGRGVGVAWSQLLGDAAGPRQRGRGDNTLGAWPPAAAALTPPHRGTRDKLSGCFPP